MHCLSTITMREKAALDLISWLTSRSGGLCGRFVRSLILNVLGCRMTILFGTRYKSGLKSKHDA